MRQPPADVRLCDVVKAGEGAPDRGCARGNVAVGGANAQGYANFGALGALVNATANNSAASTSAALAIPVPEPSAPALILGGLGLALTVLSRRQGTGQVPFSTAKCPLIRGHRNV
ncbi:PEP-CTERM sorting domain-containing protein [Aquabacterium sp.]|uniref:PEP-CTERM sorting domain-containing protein n=1 Tax=Aquabacterium sp. TaxID=1872578 RepID=UPI0019848D0C|nr:PEP-CTERM sorting domain-containing protein [Aquabacterium sp.]MBC7699925.1 PEP-CTERM sorting domain-containing protein [Aquabacterium sp.]